MTVMSELSETINFLEAQIPANPQSEKHVRLANRLERELVEYFKSLATAFDYSKLDSLYNKHIKESIGSEAEDIVDPILKVLKATLLQRLNSHLLVIYLSGQAEMISWGKTKGGIPLSYEGPPIQSAIKWAEKHCATLVTNMDTETKSKLAKIISEGIDNKRGIPGLARDIRTEFADMSKFRSQMIARTETADALSQASLESMQDMGIEGKEWVVNNPCEICAANGDEGVIPVSQAFSSGDMAPPAHPNCVCAIAPARLSK